MHLIPFYEYFHGDDGAGIGASHQTGWTGAIATLIQLFAFLTADDLRNAGGRPGTAYAPGAASSSGQTS